MNNKLVILYLAIPFLLISCKSRNESISPEIKNITESVYASGIIKSKNQYEVFSKSNGILGKIFATEGTYVKKGDPLFQVEDVNINFDKENARLSSVANDYFINSDRLNDAQNNIQLAQKKLLIDSLMYSRQQNLWKNKIGSRVEVEQNELNFENSKVALAHAKASYEDLKRQLKLVSGQSKNNFRLAERSEDDLIIRSEVDGIVYKINKEIGELVSNLTALAIVGEDNFIIEMDIDELDIVKVKTGQQVFVRMDSYKSEVFEANVVSVFPMMNDRTRTFKVEAVFTKMPLKLYPNLTLEANVVIKSQQNVLTIPINYLINDTTVMLENGKLQEVKVGLKDYNLAEIIRGITSSSRIILPGK